MQRHEQEILAEGKGARQSRMVVVHGRDDLQETHWHVSMRITESLQVKGS